MCLLWMITLKQVDNHGEQVKFLAYIGWFWEPNHTDNVVVATNSDKSEDGVSLSKNDGPILKMEHHCTVLQNFLFRCCKRHF
jgi:hypothetical protein